ncbi:MAG: phage holin family protein [Rikenellaceae bacterium]|jgi:phage-related holin|nr:phage holin family protein [Rikenellaceae bacterium]
MGNIFKYIAGSAVSLLALLAPVRPLIICALVFVAIDFVTGVAASYKRARRAGEPWGFESGKAWATVAKLAFVMGGIVLAWLIDVYILDFLNLNLAKLFTGFVCGVEFWSYLENAAEISDHPVFRWLRQFMKKKFYEKIGADEPGIKE